jgi:C-terminal processing protease CtpA/Prc
LSSYGEPKLVFKFLFYFIKKLFILLNRKIYNALSKDRLKELDENMNNYSKEYDEVYKEIENILSGGMDGQLSLLLDGTTKK